MVWLRLPNLCLYDIGQPLEKQKVTGEIAADRTSAVSSELAVAQRKLEQFRQAFRRDYIKRQPTPVKHGRSHSPKSLQNHETRPFGNRDSCLPKTLPSHLGWHSAPATRAYRAALRNQALGKEISVCPPIKLPQKGGDKSTFPRNSPSDSQTVNNTTISVPPDLALAILREKLAAPGRIWLLLRQLDSQGKGWVTAETAREKLTNKQTPLFVCGKRQLRNLLAAGESIFWERDNKCIWLKSLAKVAVELGVTRFNGRSVQLPLPVLLQSIGTVRAHFYATLHSSRSKPSATSGAVQNKPISRKTLKTLSSATRRTQRLYEKRAGIRQQNHFALGSHFTAEGEQDLAWQLGRAYFRFKDHKGLVGPAGQRYLAWQLPNSYDGPHDIDSKSHQRRINRQLTDLLTIGITGNGEGVSEKTDTMTMDATDGYRKTMFYQDGSKAAKHYNRQPQDLYWQSRVGRTGYGNGRFRLWHSLPAQPVDKSA